MAMPFSPLEILNSHILEVIVPTTKSCRIKVWSLARKPVEVQHGLLSHTCQRQSLVGSRCCVPKQIECRKKRGWEGGLKAPVPRSPAHWRRREAWRHPSAIWDSLFHIWWCKYRHRSRFRCLRLQHPRGSSLYLPLGKALIPYQSHQTASCPPIRAKCREGAPDGQRTTHAHYNSWQPEAARRALGWRRPFDPLPRCILHTPNWRERKRDTSIIKMQQNPTKSNPLPKCILQSQLEWERRSTEMPQHWAKQFKQYGDHNVAHRLLIQECYGQDYEVVAWPICQSSDHTPATAHLPWSNCRGARDYPDDLRTITLFAWIKDSIGYSIKNVVVKITKWLHNLFVSHRIIHLQLPIYQDRSIAEVRVAIRIT